MTNQPDTPQPDHKPDPAAPPPITPDGTSGTPGAEPAGGNAPISGQPWPTPSGDPLSPEPYQPPPPKAYAPGYASIPQPEPEPDFPPTSQFPAQGPVNYAPPGQAPDYGHSGYAGQAGYPPAGYPPPGYPPPGYGGQPGYGPPPPPPRKSNAPIIAVILAVALLLCGGVATAGVLIARNIADKANEAVGPLTDLPTEAPELPGLPTNLPTDSPNGIGHKITVTYEVSGDGPVSIVYIEKVGDAPVQLADVKLPWKLTTEMETPALVSVVAVRVDTSAGKIGCRALVDGDEVKSNTSDQGNFATVSCTHLTLD